MAAGWIGLKREIWDNPLWLEDTPFDNRSAYIDMLLQAGYTDKKVIAGGALLDVGFGSFVTSQDKLAARWSWGRQKVRTFLKLLEQAQIIKVEAHSKYTLITMLRDLSQPTNNQQITNKKPDDNQQITSEEPTDNQEVTNSEPTDNQQITTTNKVNNINNINNINKGKKENKGNNHHVEVSGGISVDPNNPFVLWENYGFGTFSYQLAEDLKQLIAETSENAVCQAIKIAAKNDKKFLRYVESVANRIASGKEFKYDKGQKNEKSLEEIASDLEKEYKEGAFFRDGTDSQYSDYIPF